MKFPIAVLAALSVWAIARADETKEIIIGEKMAPGIIEVTGDSGFPIAVDQRDRVAVAADASGDG
ncbi:MAG: hypothetical protein AAF585_24220, partial [Verrucomicrobiota bacterium]